MHPAAPAISARLSRASPRGRGPPTARESETARTAPDTSRNDLLRHRTAAGQPRLDHSQPSGAIMALAEADVPGFLPIPEGATVPCARSPVSPEACPAHIIA